MNNGVSASVRLAAVSVLALAVLGSGPVPRGEASTSAACNFNDVCENGLGEFGYNCSDCPLNCGDSYCQGGEGEDCESCPADCCPDPPPNTCGDSWCDTQSGETWENCPEDCSPDCGVCWDEYDCWLGGCPVDFMCYNHFCQPHPRQ